MSTIEELRAKSEDREHLLADLLEKAATELEQLTAKLDAAHKCATCGEPLSHDCPKCESMWKS